MTPFRTRDLTGGVFVVALALATVLCGFILAFNENGRPAPARPTSTQVASIPTTITIAPPPTIQPTLTPAGPSTGNPTATPNNSPSTSPAVQTISLSPTPPPITQTGCQPPADWQQIRVSPGETLFTIGLRYSLRADVLQQANCLDNSQIFSGQLLYVPNITPIAPTEVCGVPPEWGDSSHIVQRGETLFSLAQRYNTDVDTLRRANCLANTRISTGQRLNVPPLAQTGTPTTTTPQATATAGTPAPTDTPIPAATLPAPGFAFDSCIYIEGTEDYRCIVVIFLEHGTAPWTVHIEGAGNGGPFTWGPDDPHSITIEGRRCASAFFTIVVTDANGLTARLETGFIPADQPLFPPDNTSACVGTGGGGNLEIPTETPTTIPTITTTPTATATPAATTTAQ